MTMFMANGTNSGYQSALPPDASREAEELAIAWGTDAGVTVVVGLRIFTSLWVLRKMTTSDHLIVAALSASYICHVFSTLAVHYGMGRHAIYLPIPNLEKAMMWEIIATGWGQLCPILARLSFIVFLLNLVVAKRLRYILHACIWLNIVANGLTTVLLFSQCGPRVRDIWNVASPTRYKCWPYKVQSDYNITCNAINAMLDLTLTALPGWVVWQLRLPRKTKIGLAILLGLSLFAAVAAIAKAIKLSSDVTLDFTWDFVPTAIWFTVENMVVMLASSIPGIKPLFSYQKIAARSSLSPSSYEMTALNRPRHYDAPGYFGYYVTEVTSDRKSRDKNAPRNGIHQVTTVTQTDWYDDNDENKSRISRGDSEAELAQTR